jgi:arylformamidase
MRKIIDISLEITPDLIVWPGDPPVHVERIMKIEAGDTVNVTTLRMSAHTGTHLDAPYHFIDGKRTVDQIQIQELIGPVQVVGIPEEINLISRDLLEQILSDPVCEKIIFKTRNTNSWINRDSSFNTSYIGLDEEAANYLIKKNIKLVGIDYLSVAPFENQIKTHRALLKENIIILEGLNLSSVDPGMYFLICLPLKLKGSDGAPMRAVLIDEDPID